MVKVLSTIVVAVLFGGACATGPVNARDRIVPLWVDSGSHSDYPGPQYLTAMGEGETSTDADKLAYLRLGEQLKVDIQGSTAIAKAYSSSNDAETFSEDINLNVAARVDLKDVKGLRVLERHLDNHTGVHYSFAVLDRSAATAQLAVEIDHVQERIAAALDTANSQLKQGQPSAAFRSIAEIDQQLQTLVLKTGQYGLFSGPEAYADKLADGRKLEQRVVDFVTTVARDTRVSLIGPERRDGVVGQGVATPFEVQFAYRQASQNTPLSGLPVAYAADDAMRVFADQSTNSAGLFVLRVSDLSYTEREVNEIVLNLDFANARIRDAFPVTKVYVAVPRKSTTRVQVLIDIDGIAPGARRTIEEGIKATLVAENYSVAGSGEEADVRLELRGRIMELPGMGRIRFANITGALRLVSTRTETLIDTVVIDESATKGGGLGLDRAAQKSAGKLIDAVRLPLLKAMESNVGRS